MIMGDVSLSYWDNLHVSSLKDVIIVGAGITGLSCALRISQLRPELNIRIIDKHQLTRVASTRNAGFACFGSLTEIQDDIIKHGESVAFDLVERRYKGIQLIRKTFSSQQIDYNHTGGFELINKGDMLNENLLDEIQRLNQSLKEIIGDDVFKLLPHNQMPSSFTSGTYVVKNAHEGQLNPSKFVRQLAGQLPSATTEILEGVELKSQKRAGDYLALDTSRGVMKARMVILATNGLTDALNLEHDKIKPARNLVMVSEKLNLGFEGVYHAEQGYIYFRNVGDRLLIGGGRHWDRKTEYSQKFGENEFIKSKLKAYAQETIFANGPVVKFDYQWSGIMGITQNKAPIIKRLQEGLFLAAGFGGMGVALGMHSGFEIAELACKDKLT